AGRARLGQADGFGPERGGILPDVSFSVRTVRPVIADRPFGPRASFGPELPQRPPSHSDPQPARPELRPYRPPHARTRRGRSDGPRSEPTDRRHDIRPGGNGFEEGFVWDKPLHLGGPMTGPLMVLHTSEGAAPHPSLPTTLST